MTPIYAMLALISPIAESIQPSKQIAIETLQAAETAMGVYVGELQERWTFPSDHLPIGATVEGLKIASWNVLNTKHIGWVEKNTQGLSRSMLIQDNVAINAEGLTRRDEKTIGKIREMIEKGKDLICLQECGRSFVQELKRQLPEHFALALRSGLWSQDQEAILYNTKILSLERAQCVTGVYSEQPKRPLMDVLFKRLDMAAALRVINVHVPGDPEGPARGEIARYLATCSGPVLCLGDFNFNEWEMGQALAAAGLSKEGLLSPYCTNINPKNFRSKCIDHFYLSPELEGTVDDPEELLTGLGQILDLLESSSLRIAFNRFISYAPG